jgi:hypothetical protein
MAITFSCERNGPPLTVDPERFNRSGEKRKGCLVRERCSKDRSFSSVIRLPAPGLFSDLSTRETCPLHGFLAL